MLKRRKRERAISKRTTGTKLFSQDDLDVDRMSKNQEKTRGEIVRVLVAGQLRHQRLKEAGQDEAMVEVRYAQKLVVEEAIAPLITQLTQQKEYVETASRRTLAECVEIRERMITVEDNSRLMMSGFNRIMQNIVLIRALLWHYIFTFYQKILAGAGRKVTNEELQKNYEERLAEIKLEEARARHLFDETVAERAVNIVGQNLLKNTVSPPPETLKQA